MFWFEQNPQKRDEMYEADKYGSNGSHLKSHVQPMAKNPKKKKRNTPQCQYLSYWTSNEIQKGIFPKSKNRVWIRQLHSQPLLPTWNSNSNPKPNVALKSKYDKKTITKNFVKALPSPPTKTCALDMSRPTKSDVERILKLYSDDPSFSIHLNNLTEFMNDSENFCIIEKQDMNLDKNDSFKLDFKSMLIDSLKMCWKENLYQFNNCGLFIGENEVMVQCDFEFGKNQNLLIQGMGCGRNVEQNVAEKAITFFKKLFPTVQINMAISSSLKVRREDLIPDPPSGFAVDAPVATKLLLKMGWKGGGLGVREDGICEPIKVNSNGGRMARAGFGSNFSKSSLPFKDSLNQLLKREEERMGIFDIDFTSSFTEGEFNIIKKKVTVDSLYTVTIRDCGGVKKILNLSRKMEFYKLVQEVVNHGGRNVKYKVILPDFYSQVSSKYNQN